MSVQPLPLFKEIKKPVRVCVLACSYEDSCSELKEFEGDLIQTPQHYFTNADAGEYVFSLELIKKATAYKQIRQLVMSKKYDVFYNQCDGAKDEDRAGLEVVQALEEFNVPFTGSMSKYYEMTKPDMKMVCFYYGIPTANHALLSVEDEEGIPTSCAHLRFPVIVKHMSGYSSIGMEKNCKVHTMEELVTRAKAFMEVYQFALVEEFIVGDEATILVCNDSSQPDGIRVFPPVKVNFPPGEDFKHFKLKWESYEGMEWQLVAEDDPALSKMLQTARKAFQHMMGGVGYGRVDVRINRETDDVTFLEINPNCGIMYPYGQEGSADWILRLNPDFHQKEFAILQINDAIERNKQNQKVYVRKFNPKRGYHLCAACDLPKGHIVFFDEGQHQRLCTKPFVRQYCKNEEAYRDFAENAWPVGGEGHYYALWDHDPAQWRHFNHSCTPNMHFAGRRSLNVITTRAVKKGEELTMDYRQFMDSTMPPFQCNCQSLNCAGLIVAPVSSTVNYIGEDYNYFSAEKRLPWERLLKIDRKVDKTTVLV